MSTFGPDNYSTSILQTVGRLRSPVVVDGLRTSFVAALEEAKHKPFDDDPSVSDRKRSLEGTMQRKSLDKNEIEATVDRNRQIDDEYQHRLDRRERSNEKSATEPISKSFEATATNLQITNPEPRIPNHVLVQPGRAAELTVVEPPTPMLIVPVATEGSPSIPCPQMPEVDAPIQPTLTTPTVSINSQPKPVTDPSAFTIFTVSGRFGIEKKEKDTDGKKTEKRDRGIPLFGSLLPLPSETPIASRGNAADVDDEPPSGGVERGTWSAAQAERNTNHGSPKTPLDTLAEHQGISLMELFESKVFEPYKGTLPIEVESDQAERVRFVQRVVAACQSAANRNGTVRIKLHPESLGSLTIRVTAKKGKLSVHFETETDDAKRLLLDGIDDLRASLREMKYELEEWRVD